MTNDDSRVSRTPTRIAPRLSSLMRRVTNSWGPRYLQDYENYVNLDKADTSRKRAICDIEIFKKM